MILQPNRFMKRTSVWLGLTLAALGLTASLPAGAGTLYPVIVGGESGFVDKNGRLVVNPQFDAADAFASDLARVKIAGRWGYISRDGKYVINPQFDEATPFTDGLARVKISRKVGSIDDTGRFIWNPTN